MIIDNENSPLKIHEWISKYTEEGSMDIVTGYFTVGAIAHVSREINNKISQYRMILGDIVNTDLQNERPLDLLNENITIEASLKLSNNAKSAVSFLKQESVLAKTLEPNFCHAKLTLFKPSNDDDRNYFNIMGSSNLTEAGMGLKITSNIELNSASLSNDKPHQQLSDWFESIWNKPQAHITKTLINKDGKASKVDFKEYLINEIEKIFNKSINLISSIVQVLDSVVFNLYFPDHMREREIDVLEYVERDLEKSLQGREFDSLSVQEKEKVIEQLHATWSNPDNEVVKRMAQFNEKSPDILKPILES